MRLLIGLIILLIANTASLLFGTEVISKLDMFSLLRTLSPIVSIQSEYFKGTGILFLLNEEPHILTSSHVVFHHGTASKTVKFIIPKTTFSHFYSTMELDSVFEAELVFDDPIADFSFLKVNTHSRSHSLSSTNDFKFLDYWASKSFKLNTRSSGLGDWFSSMPLEFNNGAIKEWMNPHFKNGIIGIDYLQSNKTVLIPVIEPYEIQFELDTDISGLLQQQIRLPTFAKPGLSGSIIVKDSKIVGLVSKVSFDGSPMVYGVHFDEIVQRYFASLKKNPTMINTTAAHWRLNERGYFYLEYTNSYGTVIMQPLKSNAEQRVGDPGEGGDWALGVENIQNGETITHWRDAKLWKFSSVNVTSNLFIPSLMSQMNPFYRTKPLPLMIRDKNSSEFQSIALMEEESHGQSRYSLPSIMSMNKKNILESKADLSLGTHLIAINTPEYKEKTLKLEELRRAELRGLKPKYVRFSYKLNSDFHCYNGIGNAWTWDNTMAVDLKDRNSLRQYLENQLTVVDSSLDNDVDNDINDFHSENQKHRVGFFQFELNNPNVLLKVQTDFGNHKDAISQCLEKNKMFIRSAFSSVGISDSNDILKNFDIMVSSVNLDIISIVEKNYITPNRVRERKYDLYKDSNSTISNYVRYERPELKGNDSDAPRVLLVFDPKNLVKLDKIYVDTPFILFEFLYYDLNQKSPR